jgi:hypothetical protein
VELLSSCGAGFSMWGKQKTQRPRIRFRVRGLCEPEVPDLGQVLCSCADREVREIDIHGPARVHNGPLDRHLLRRDNVATSDATQSQLFTGTPLGAGDEATRGQREGGSVTED